MKKKLISSILAVATISSCAFATVACTDKVSDTPTQTVQQMATNDIQVRQTKNQGITLTTTTYEDTDIETYVYNVTEKTITATISPADAEQSVTWTLSWANPSSKWASGKDVEDYMKLTENARNALQVEVSMKKQFGEQIVLTVTADADSSVSAECTLDCYERVASIDDVVIYTSHLSSSNQFSCEYAYSSEICSQSNCSSELYYYAHTVNVDYEIAYYIVVYDNFVNACKAQGMTVKVKADEFSQNIGIVNLVRPLVDSSNFESDFKTAMSTLGVGTEIGKIVVVASSASPSLLYSESFPIVLTKSCVTATASNISLDTSSVIF